MVLNAFRNFSKKALKFSENSLTFFKQFIHMFMFIENASLDAHRSLRFRWHRKRILEKRYTYSEYFWCAHLHQLVTSLVCCKIKQISCKSRAPGKVFWGVRCGLESFLLSSLKGSLLFFKSDKNNVSSIWRCSLKSASEHNTRFPYSITCNGVATD